MNTSYFLIHNIGNDMELKLPYLILCKIPLNGEIEERDSWILFNKIENNEYHVGGKHNACTPKECVE